MARRIIQQRRGRGTSTYRVPSKKFKPKVEYKEEAGVVVDIVNNPLMDAPLAKVAYPAGHGYIIAPEGIAVGQSTEDVVFPLSRIKEGTQICAIEIAPHSGPSLCRSPGATATLVSKSEKAAVIQLPSKKTKTLHLACRASLGTPAGDGAGEKPFVKAGTRWHAMHARGKLYPRTSGNKMNVVDHPFGGSGHGTVRRPVSRHSPPGRKVGTVSPKKTGKKN